MSEHQMPEFTQEELGRQAGGIGRAAYLAIVSYAREEGIPPEDILHWMGRRFAPGWEEMRGNLEDVAYQVALNSVAVGSELRGYDVGEDEATITLTRTPSMDDSGPAQDGDILNETYRPIMDYLDIDYEWETEGDNRVLRLRQRANT